MHPFTYLEKNKDTTSFCDTVNQISQETSAAALPTYEINRILVQIQKFYSRKCIWKRFLQNGLHFCYW